MTSRIKILGWAHVIVNGGLLALVVPLSLMLLTTTDTGSRAPDMLLPMFGTASAFLLIPGFLGGMGLLYGRRWGRILITVVSAMYLLAFPIGTVPGALGLWILLGRDADTVFSGDKQGGGIEGWISLLPGHVAIYAIFAGVGAGFVAVIGTGFLFNEGYLPPALAPFYYPSFPVLAVSLAYGIVNAVRMTQRPNRKIGREIIDAAMAAAAAEPDHTCAHLLPIETAMRRAGIKIRGRGRHMDAVCQVDTDGLARLFPVEGAFYRAFMASERAQDDTAVAQFWCAACNARIGVIHPKIATKNTPVFPA